MQTGQTNTTKEQAIKAIDFIRVLLALTTEISAEMHNVRASFDGETITAFFDDAKIIITPAEAKEGGAA